jgi:4-amino-4-deoxy-L-arabinose transferase-like glycosyltransferase
MTDEKEQDGTLEADDVSTDTTEESSPESDEQSPAIGNLARFEDDTRPWWRDRWLLLILAVALFLPFLGSFGLWDPWETHYGEVARQILERNDWISTWWGSHWQDASGNQEGSYFYSKPILLMWMMAMGMSVFGFNAFGIRIGVALVAVLATLLVYSMGASVFKRRVGYLMAGVMATSPFFFFLSRQAQTDMPFVGLMTVGLCFFMMAMFGKDRERPADKFSYGLSLGWIALIVIPQLTLILVGLSRWRGAGNPFMQTFTTPAWQGVAFGGIILGIAAIVLAVGLWIGRKGTEEAKKRRFQLGIASVVALWLPLLVMLVIILVNSGSLPRDVNGWFVWGPTQTALYATCLGFVLYWCFARPVVERRRVYLLAFYAFIGLASLAKGLLGFMLPGAVLFFYILLTREWRMLKKVDLHIGTATFIAVAFPWYAAMLVRHTHGFWNRFFVHDHFKRLASGVHQIDTGSFEHFIHWLGYGLFPWTAFLPAALANLFTGRGLKMEDDRGRATLMLILWATIGFTLFTLSSTKFHHYIFPVVPPLAMLIALAIDDALDRDVPEPWPVWFAGIGIFLVVAWDMIADPQALKNLFTYKYDRKWDYSWNESFRWTMFYVFIPGLLGATLLLARNRLLRRISLGAVFATAIGFAVFSLNVYMPEVSSTWSQKGVWDAYYEQCTPIDPPPGSHRFKRYCEEPAIAFKLNWRGETYYTQNEVIPIRDDDDFNHFLKEVGDGTFYGIMEMSSFNGNFQRELPKRFKGKGCVVYDENLKFILAKVPCAPDDPHRVDTPKK